MFKDSAYRGEQAPALNADGRVADEGGDDGQAARGHHQPGRYLYITQGVHSQENTRNVQDKLVLDFNCKGWLVYVD